ncbi:DUF2264 domain-containing protein [Pontiella sulfatireligans]|uniref:DUF2264 domain-containing protein n=1 Tax=Pontiella sulfatireligans TaxID=2750658 RepID=A0A6C2UQV0_9BACT|nr:DUF2264 domain-containing protein [Pontiella sulfatireligans]VGO22323.1 hypothetical protein SCARR_04406 [Pontiella sulfatireligans]
MKAFDLPIASNPLKTRADVQEAVRQICEPLKPHYSEGKALVHLGATCTNYGERRCEMEAFARPFWGLMPLAAGGGDSNFWDICRKGLLNGTNPAHPEYWGELGEVDQLAVEMPPIALALALSPDQFWTPFSQAEREQIATWMDQINHKAMSDNNWRAFPILVNASLKKAGMPYNAEVMEAGLDRLEDFYLGNGWYSDGTGKRMDYYIPFAIHFYSLIYAKLMGDEDPQRAAIFKDRATIFAKDFLHWFTAEGAALPFGRSLTYRFAQGAFWGALAFADVEALPWGEIKGLFLRHLRHWFRKPIFTADGLLSIGYDYPNLLMSEFYNGPGSPYWAMKAFLPLAVAEDHPFWTSEELPFPRIGNESVQKPALMSIAHSENRDHLVALASGQWCGLDFGHTAEKYSKFAYSTHFGFSVSREATGLVKGAYDSMLALSDGEDHWRVRRQCELVEITDDAVISVWKPWPDVEIETRLEHRYPWHIRTHTIKTGRALETAEGGFAASREAESVPKEGAVGVLYGGSGILNIEGEREASVVEPLPNTNLMNPCTAIPTLTGRLEPGKHRLVCAVLGEPDAVNALKEWNAYEKSVDGIVTVRH